VPGLADAGFGDLLTMVASGRLRSDRAITVAPGAALDPPLAERQLERLAAAADEAEAAGARRAVMLIDGRGVVLQVGDRRVDGEVAPGTPLIDIDAAVAVPADASVSDDSAAANATNATTAAGHADPRGGGTADPAPASREPGVIGRIGRPLGPPPALPAHVARAIPGRGTPLAGEASAGVSPPAVPRDPRPPG